MASTHTFLGGGFSLRSGLGEEWGPPLLLAPSSKTQHRLFEAEHHISSAQLERTPILIRVAWDSATRGTGSLKAKPG